jgi:hypothetical protein
VSTEDANPRSLLRFQPEWTEQEMDAISALAQEKEMSQKSIVRAAVRLYQAVHLGACKVEWSAPAGCPDLGDTANAITEGPPTETSTKTNQ